MANTYSAAHEGGHEHEGHYGHIPLRTYWMVFGALMGLMALTVGAYYLEKLVLPLPEVVAVGIAMLIAICKTALIMVFFMHLKVSSKLARVFAASSFVWLMIMFTIIMGDYFAKGWPPQQGPLTAPASYTAPAAPAEGWLAL
ncbi:oxidase [Chloroflexales bacterium ZM16-3]|nr:oxidase [Chloroflexales bacterium ZM16-3]